VVVVLDPAREGDARTGRKEGLGRHDGCA
jgi:hypothetical protein